MKNSIISIFLLVIFFSSEYTFSQTAQVSGKGKITGVVVDSLTLKPIEFATVGLVDATNGNTVNGAMADEKGMFEIAKLPMGQYKVIVLFVGYNKLETDSIILTDKRKEIHLDTIKLRLTTMQEIVITDKQALVEETVDRIIYHADQDANNKGGDATDVLRKVPMLSVDMDGNVTLRGSQNIKVLINNKPSTIIAASIADALKQIPSDQIKSVEVITSPSAKYDAEGSAGIINIITKKNTLQGFSFNVDASAGVRGSSLGLNGGYRKKKMGFTFGGFGRAGYNIPGTYTNKQVAYDLTNNTSTTNIQHAHSQNVMEFGNYSLGWDYDIDSNNSITANVKYSLRNGIVSQTNFLTQTYNTNDSLTGSNLKNVNTTNLSNTIDGSLTYTHLFKKPKREFNLMALMSRNYLTNDFNYSTFNNADVSLVSSRLKNQNLSVNQEITLQADYQHPFSKNLLMEMGAKDLSRNISSNYQYFNAAGANGPFMSFGGDSLNNKFKYNQNISAAYNTYTYTFLKDYTVKAGVRYEYTDIKANFTSAQSVNINIPSYNVLVPSINISKKLSKGRMFKVSFNRRIQRPSMQFLNPNKQASNPYNYSIGNPNLRPEYSNNYEISYSSHISKTSFTIAAFMRNTTGAIESVRNVVSDSIIQTTYKNIGTENVYGTNIFSNINISNRFTLGGGMDAFYDVLNNNNSNPLYSAHNQGWVVSGRANGSYDLTHGWGLQVFGFYRARQVQLQGFQSGFGIYSLSLKKDLPNKKGSIGFGAENFFTPSIRVHTTLNSPELTQTSTNITHNMNFKINFSYRIGKITSGDKKPRKKSINNDDLKTGNDNTSGTIMNTPPSGNPK
jgi:outer membrane receptor protein involved in Fe transport